MADLNRRAFLTRSSMVAAFAGIASFVPGLTKVMDLAQTEAPELDSAATATASSEAADVGVGAADASAPLVAHVRDLSTGEIGVFNGTREIVVRDPQLARSILRAAR